MKRTRILTALMVLALLPVLSTCGGGNTDTWEVSTIMEPTENSLPELVLHTQIADLSQNQADCTLTIHEITYTTGGARLRISIDNQSNGRAVIVTTTSSAQQNGETRRARRIYAGGDERGSAFLSA
ncbi:MAG: hypothetical protein LIO46_04190, partial [Clostridiales bacterium]|nr:hypothetical protein [Clostridiales bacterium]